MLAYRFGGGGAKLGSCGCCCEGSSSPDFVEIAAAAAPPPKARPPMPFRTVLAPPAPFPRAAAFEARTKKLAPTALTAR